jgi:hypothetical protein
MEPYTIFFIIVNALHVSGGFSAHHQELKNCTRRIGYGTYRLLVCLQTNSNSPTLAVAASKLGTYPMLRVQFWSS